MLQVHCQTHRHDQVFALTILRIKGYLLNILWFDFNGIKSCLEIRYGNTLAFPSILNISSERSRGVLFRLIIILRARQSAGVLILLSFSFTKNSGALYGDLLVLIFPIFKIFWAFSSIAFNTTGESWHKELCGGFVLYLFRFHGPQIFEAVGRLVTNLEKKFYTSIKHFVIGNSSSQKYSTA